MRGRNREIHRRAQRTFRVAKWKADKAMERRELRLLRKERELRYREARRRKALYG